MQYPGSLYHASCSPGRLAELFSTVVSVLPTSARNRARRGLAHSWKSPLCDAPGQAACSWLCDATDSRAACAPYTSLFFSRPVAALSMPCGQGNQWYCFHAFTTPFAACAKSPNAHARGSPRGWLKATALQAHRARHGARVTLDSSVRFLSASLAAIAKHTSVAAVTRQREAVSQCEKCGRKRPQGCPCCVRQQICCHGEHEGKTLSLESPGR